MGEYIPTRLEMKFLVFKNYHDGDFSPAALKQFFFISINLSLGHALNGQ